MIEWVKITEKSHVSVYLVPDEESGRQVPSLNVFNEGGDGAHLYGDAVALLDYLDAVRKAVSRVVREQQPEVWADYQREITRRSLASLAASFGGTVGEDGVSVTVPVPEIERVQAEDEGRDRLFGRDGDFDC